MEYRRMTKREQVQLEEIASSKLQAVNSWYMAIGKKNMAPSKTQNTSLFGEGQSAWYLQNLRKARV
jgi:hypothetical protein